MLQMSQMGSEDTSCNFKTYEHDSNTYFCNLSSHTIIDMNADKITWTTTTILKYRSVFQV